jgi:hypothetical protein
MIETVWQVLWQVLGSLGGVAVLLGAAGWVARLVAQHTLTRNLEKYKAELKTSSDKEVENIRAELKNKTLEHEVKFRKLHDKVADVIADLFFLLSKYYSSVGSYVSPFDWAGETKQTKLEAVDKALKAFHEYFYDHRLFVPVKLFGQIEELHIKLHQMTNRFHLGMRQQEQGIFNKDKDHWEEGREGMMEAMPMYEKIHAASQEIIGLQVAS